MAWLIGSVELDEVDVVQLIHHLDLILNHILAEHTQLKRHTHTHTHTHTRLALQALYWITRTLKEEVGSESSDKQATDRCRLAVMSQPFGPVSDGDLICWRICMVGFWLAMRLLNTWVDGMVTTKPFSDGWPYQISQLSPKQCGRGNMTDLMAVQVLFEKANSW